MFNENSVLAITWAKLVKEGKYSRGQVPRISNLQEAVYLILDREGE